jgi:hypothetical protein
LEAITLKRLIILSLSVLVLLILIPGCITIQVPAATTTPPVIGTFTNLPSSTNPGGTATLMWNVTGANSVSIDQGIGQVDMAGVKAISPALSTVYTMSATNSYGTVTRTATATVSSPVIAQPAIMEFSSNLNSDGTSTLLWNVSGASVVSIDQNVGQVNVAGTRIVSPSVSTVYTLSATNSAGTITKSAVVNMQIATPVIAQFSSYVNNDGTSTLVWAVNGANSVYIDQGIGQVNSSGTRIVSPAAYTMYNLTATNSAGSVSRSAATTSTSGTPVIMEFSSNLNSDGTSTLLWNVTGANIVSINQNIGQVNVAGITIVSPPSSTTYTLTATNSYGTVTRSVTSTTVRAGDTGTPWVQ